VIPLLAQKLIPRLASSFDGEVVATARALERALKGEGLDLHDLTRMANAAPLSRDCDLPESETAKRARAQLKEILAKGWLDRSVEFAESVLERRNLDLLSEAAGMGRAMRKLGFEHPQLRSDHKEKGKTGSRYYQRRETDPFLPRNPAADVRL
jgi:hypothetical protein